jgi:hypothetical protein
MQTFVPSEYSYQATLNPRVSGSTATALAAGGTAAGVAAAGGVGAVTAATTVGLGAAAGTIAATGGLAAPIVALAAGGIALSKALRSKDKKYADAEAKAARFERKYRMTCKKRGKKGCYPDKKGKGPFFKDGRGDYKKWKHWEARAAKLAKDLKKKWKKKGKLDKQTEKELDAAINRPNLIANAEKAVVRSVKVARGEPIPADFETSFMETEEDAAAVPAGISPMMVGGIAVGALVVGGGLMWALRR